ncbi:Metallo-hydrolase/oxidoreductase [Lactarius vividus]|nr:Metallo-hydrolase/oxidoreductase [Lactarius vividus]
MEKLAALKPITRISDKVVRILGQNPGKFTLQGTNTYIVGASNPYILVDTGEGKSEYLPTLRMALENLQHPSLPDISDIILTHRHHDHIRGLPSVLSLCREIWEKRNPETPFLPPRIHKRDDYLPAPGGGHFHDLADGQKLTASCLYCPGHTADSISLLFAADRALFTGDAVLGHGTAVFEDLYDTTLATNTTALYPGHGPVINDGAQTIRAYIDHRLERESQVLAVLSTTPPEGSWTTWTIVSRVYEGYPESLFEAAARGITLHLKKLEREGRVRYQGGESKEARWELVH